MDNEIVGLVQHNGAPPRGGQPAPDFDPEFIKEQAIAHEAAGFDRVLIANTATMPDSMSIAAYITAATTKLGLMIAHRPGFIAPTMAARMLATVDRLSHGRAAVHIIAGADDREVQADGAFNTKEQRYRVAAEYVQVMRRVWSSAQPFDHDGEFYKFRGAFSSVRPKRGTITVNWGGLSDLSIDFAAQLADIYAMGGDTLAGIGEVVRKVNDAMDRHGRRIELLMTINVIVADTERAAWDRTKQVLERGTALSKNLSGGSSKTEDAPASLQFKRLLDRADEGDRLDKCLWTGLNKAMGGRGNNSVLVGTPEQVADALMDYRKLGINRFLLRGPAPIELADSIKIGREMIPLLRAKFAEADRSSQDRTSAVTSEVRRAALN